MRESIRIYLQIPLSNGFSDSHGHHIHYKNLSPALLSSRLHQEFESTILPSSVAAQQWRQVPRPRAAARATPSHLTTSPHRPSRRIA